MDLAHRPSDELPHVLAQHVIEGPRAGPVRTLGLDDEPRRLAEMVDEVSEQPIR